MKVWIGWLAAVLSLNENGVSPCSFPETGVRLPLTGHRTKAQTGHNYFVVRDKESSRYFFKSYRGSECTPLCHLGLPSLCKLQWCMKNASKENMRDERNGSSADLRFVSHGSMEHAGSKWDEDHCIRYHGDLVTEIHDLPDAISFAQRVSIALSSKKANVSVEEDPDKQKGDSEEDVMIGGRFEKGRTVKRAIWTFLRSC